MSDKLRLYIDMDNVIVDFMSGVRKLDPEVLESHRKTHGDKDLDDIEGVFALMDPMPGAIEAVTSLAKQFDTFILSTSPWNNPSAWSDKVRWLQTNFGVDTNSPLYKRLILSHHKDLNVGDFLIDDRPNHGAKEFEGEWVQFGSEGLETWELVHEYMTNSLRRREEELSRGLANALSMKHRTALGEARLWTIEQNDRLRVIWLDEENEERKSDETFPKTFEGFQSYLAERRELMWHAESAVDLRNLALIRQGVDVPTIANSDCMWLTAEPADPLSEDAASRVTMYFDMGCPEEDAYNMSGIEYGQEFAFNRLWYSLSTDEARKQRLQAEESDNETKD